MYDGSVNHRSGIVVINLPSTGSTSFTAAHDGEKEALYPDVTSWGSIDRAETERRYPFVPDRIVDNLVKPDVKISVAPWSRMERSPDRLEFLIDAAFKDRRSCKYDLRRPMRRRSS